MSDELKAEVGTGAPTVTHTIRLGPPWTVTPVGGGFRHARKFGRPRTLGADERVWLVCDHVPGGTEVHLNDMLVRALHEGGAFGSDITARLAPRNEVVFTMASERPLGAVRLEIRSA